MKTVSKIFFSFLIVLSLFCSNVFAANGDNTTNPLEDLYGGNIEVNENNVIIPGLTQNDKVTTGQEGAWNAIFKEYRGIIVGISGIATLTFLIFFIINFMKLGTTSGNPQMRTQCVTSLIGCGLGCAGCGGVMLFVGFFYNLLQ